jgi:RNA polymerase sigma-70 factor (ECF subfamily)
MDVYTDEEIIEQYKAGDLEAFKFLVLKYTSHIYNFTARLTDRENALDITQETFIKAWKSLHKFDVNKASFKTWLFTIAKNTTTDFLRKKKISTFTDIEDKDADESFENSIVDEDLLPDKIAEKMEDAEFLNETLAKLSKNENEILVLHYQEGLTFDEIGKILGEPLNTVKSKHRRALAKLRNMLI